MIPNKLIENIKGKLIKEPLIIRNHDDHSSFIYDNHIFRVYPERIIIDNIADIGDIDRECIKITDTRYLNILLASD